MKKDKILSCIIGVCAALFCGTIGYLFGAQGFNINQKARALKSPVTITKEIKEKGFNTKKIALVNADEAVVQGGKTINYADKLISGMPKNFESVSLEMAKEGVENGNYGAYIIIPSTFSQSVVSINSTPKPVDLQYKISSKIT
ncbi:YhgE/Pip domain-containing protein, partial [Lachnobacterium bovis]